jgi:hypothetical protein
MKWKWNGNKMETE